MTGFPVTCKCGRIWGPTAWSQLPIAGPPELAGIQEMPADPDDAVDPDGYLMRLRNCLCGSTISVPLEAERAAGIYVEHTQREADFLDRLKRALLREGVPVEAVPSREGPWWD